MDRNQYIDITDTDSENETTNPQHIPPRNPRPNPFQPYEERSDFERRFVPETGQITVNNHNNRNINEQEEKESKSEEEEEEEEEPSESGSEPETEPEDGTTYDGVIDLIFAVSELTGEAIQFNPDCGPETDPIQYSRDFADFCYEFYREEVDSDIEPRDEYGGSGVFIEQVTPNNGINLETFISGIARTTGFEWIVVASFGTVLLVSYTRTDRNGGTVPWVAELTAQRAILYIVHYDGDAH